MMSGRRAFQAALKKKTMLISCIYIITAIREQSSYFFNWISANYVRSGTPARQKHGTGPSLRRYEEVFQGIPYPTGP